MTKPTGKKRGRPRKVPEFIVPLGEDQEKWDKWLESTWGLPKEKGSTKEVLEHMLTPVDSEDPPRLVGESPGDQSLTQPIDHWSFARRATDLENEALPARWIRYLEYMNQIAELASPSDNGAAWKEAFLEHAWCHCSEDPIEMPAKIRTPEEFKKLLSAYRIEIHYITDRRRRVFEVVAYPL